MKVLFVSSGNSSHFDIVPFIKSQGDSLIKHMNTEVEFFTIKEKGLKGYIKSIPKLRHYLRKNKFNLIHAHFAYCGWVAVLTFSGLPIVLSLMGGDAYGDCDKNGKRNMKDWAMIIQGQLVQLFVKHIIVKSENLKDYVWRKQICSVVPNGVNCDKFSPLNMDKCRSELNIPRDKIALLFMGNPDDPRKNIKQLRDAHALLPDPQKYLILAPYPVDHAIVAKYFNACDILIFTSFMEGSPNIIKEASACNLRIIATPSGDILERSYELHNITMCQFTPSDLAVKIQMVRNTIYDPVDSRSSILKTLDEKVVAKRIIHIYQSVL